MAANILMTVYEIDPTQDRRWDDFLEAHPRASTFHTRGWLQALQQTYGYVPVAFTTSPPDEPLTNALCFSRISSWLSGRRLVSLPFSDHCAPLVDSQDQLTSLLTYLRCRLADERWRYVEIRPTTPVGECCIPFETEKSFYLHRLDLRPDLTEISGRFHRNCVLRKVQRATRECLHCEEGISDSLLNQFYTLLVMTRRRHRLPAQPVSWFRNLVAGMGEQIKIRLATKSGRLVAGILTLRYKSSLVYKYGCSDERFHNLGGMQFLLWNAISEAKDSGLSEFDMGRSDYEQAGLVAFKDRWGAESTELTYLRYPAHSQSSVLGLAQTAGTKYLFSCAPGGVAAAAGRALYKHMG
jgi:hypothetical protein